MNRKSIQTLLRSMRLPFLVMTPVSIFLGFATALQVRNPVNIDDLLLILLGALSAHISVNTFNEYFDFRSGLDTRTEKTPFSGGSGALVNRPDAASGVLVVAIISLAITIIVGLVFVQRVGLPILWIGLAGVAIIISYTQWLNRDPWLCLLAPGVGFGPLMVMGTHFVLTGGISPQAFLASLVPLFLASNLLLLNQYPDVEADRSVGRNHIPIAYGLRTSTRVYGLMLAGTFAIILFGTGFHFLPLSSSYSFIPLSGGIMAYIGARKHGDSPPELLPYMGLNVAAAVLTPLLLGTTIING